MIVLLTSASPRGLQIHSFLHEDEGGVDRPHKYGNSVHRSKESRTKRESHGLKTEKAVPGQDGSPVRQQPTPTLAGRSNQVLDKRVGSPLFGVKALNGGVLPSIGSS